MDGAFIAGGYSGGRGWRQPNGGGGSTGGRDEVGGGRRRGKKKAVERAGGIG